MKCPLCLRGSKVPAEEDVVVLEKRRPESGPVYKYGVWVDNV